ncbi:MAG: signal peptidase I [Pseudomonadota bacterium]
MVEQQSASAGADSAEKMRSIRPWIAALLTFLGWGVGLYYARQTKLAIRLAAVLCVGVVLIGAGALAFLFFNSPVSSASPRGFQSITDLISLGLSAVLAVGVWFYVAKLPRKVERAGPARLWGYLLIWLTPIVVSVIFAVFIRFFFLQPFHIPAASMTPTLVPNDYFIVEKNAYGYSRYSFAPLDQILPSGRFLVKEPNRGDVVIFRPPEDLNYDYVKRLVGLPGETIEMINGVLHINGITVQKDFIGVSNTGCRYGEALRYLETLPNSVSYIVQECAGDRGVLDNVGPYEVPAGQYFMLGDNRDESQDSRVTSKVGFIPFENIIGRAKLNNAASKLGRK